MSIHRRIKERRLAMGFTSHKALGDALGVSWQTVQLWEKEGGTAPKRNRLDHVAEVLGCSSTWLQYGDQREADVMLRQEDGSVTIVQMKTPQVEYIFATPEEISFLTLLRLADERERGEIMDRLNALKKTINLPTLVGGDGRNQP